MEFKGTKGEWKFIRNENNFEIEVFGMHNWLVLQTITNEKQDEANAKLISCAPEMLEMLSRIIKNSEGIIREDLISEAEELVTEATTI